jgi:glycosyltransferase involved in cell wall biosynthesis
MSASELDGDVAVAARPDDRGTGSASGALAQSGLPRDIVFASLIDWGRMPYWRWRSLFRVAVKAGHRVLWLDHFTSWGAVRTVLRDPTQLRSRLVEIDPGIHYLSSPVRAFGIRHRGAWWGTPLARAQATAYARKLGMERPLLWIAAPSGRCLRGQLAERVAIYDCPDDLAHGGAHRRDVEDEPNVIRDVDLVIACSPKLQESKSGFGTPVACVLNGVDPEHFAAALQPGPVPDRLERLPHPVIGYHGIIYDRIDWDMVRHVARARPGWSLAFVGWAPTPPPGDVVALPNVHFFGKAEFEDVPSYYRGIDVCWVPHRVNQLTVLQSSLKSYEYLASGRPVIATEIPTAEDVRSAIRVVRTGDEAVVGIEAALAAGIDSGLQHRLRVAGANSWAVRFEAMQAEILRVMK